MQDEEKLRRAQLFGYEGEESEEVFALTQESVQRTANNSAINAALRHGACFKQRITNTVAYANYILGYIDRGWGLGYMNE